MSDILTHGDIFTGIGMWCYAASVCGIETKFGCDLVYSEHHNLQAHYISALFRQNFPEAKFYNGVNKIKNPYPVDFLTMSPPCQDVSIANKNNHINNGKRTILWKKGVEVTKEIKPKYILLENVQGFLKKQFADYLKEIDKLGYSTWWQIISAKEVGYCHLRKRLWAVSFANTNGKSLDKLQLFNAVIEKKIQAESIQKKIFPNLDRIISGKISPETNSNYIRRDDGDSYKLDRVKGIGNSIVPAIAIIIFQSILELDGNNSNK